MQTLELPVDVRRDVDAHGMGHVKTLKCEKCQYFGPMAIVGKYGSYFESWPVIIIGLVCGLLPGLLLLAKRLLYPEPRTICPKCHSLSSRGFWDLIKSF
jgi:hypothetical protein